MNTKFFKLAHKLNKDYKSILLKENVHFRASLNSISLISVSQEKAELGVPCKEIIDKVDSDILPLLEYYIDLINKKSKPGRCTPEKQLQAWIIQYALSNNYYLPFNSNIRFITSELAIINNGRKAVTDILGYNVAENKLCIVELKSDRQLTRLIEQVNSFEKSICDNKDFFSDLIQIHGNPDLKIEAGNILKIIVWPYKKTSPIEELKKLNIDEYTYQENYTFIRQTNK